jgi:serine protease AprX
VYHPDVTAPGVDISSSCDTTGTVVGPCPPGSNETASGTSMASPHVAGAAAVLFQANPKLTPTELRWALQATATPVTNTEKTGDSAFWQAGYGHIDLAAAVDLVRSSNYADLIRATQRAADARVFAASGYRVDRSDIWMWAAVPATFEGVPDTRSYTIGVAEGTSALKVALSYPSLGTAGLNGMEYVATVLDGAGKVVGTTEANFTNGSSSAFVDLSTLSGLDYSKPWTIEVSGNRALSDPDTLDSDSALGRTVTMTFAQLRSN